MQDATSPLAVVLQESSSSSGISNTNSYLYQLGSTSPLFQSYGISNTNRVWYHSDGLGSVRALTNGSGQVQDTTSYSAFGGRVGESGKSSSSYGFAGEQLDPTGLYFNRARYYNPNLGRFISRDSTMGSLQDPTSLNRFIYTGNNPTLYTDPLGHDPWYNDPDFNIANPKNTPSGGVAVLDPPKPPVEAPPPSSNPPVKAPPWLPIGGVVGVAVAGGLVGLGVACFFSSDIGKLTGKEPCPFNWGNYNNGVENKVNNTGTAESQDSVLSNAKLPTEGVSSFSEQGNGEYYVSYKDGTYAIFDKNGNIKAGNAKTQGQKGSGRAFEASPKHPSENPANPNASVFDYNEDETEAQKLLDEALADPDGRGTAYYAYKNGQAYTFRITQKDSSPQTFHGFNEDRYSKIPESIWKQWIAQGKLTESERRALQRRKSN